jgi:hypothetical protein
MKFINKLKTSRFLILFTILCSVMSLKLNIGQTGVEQQDITMNIFNNSTKLMSSAIVNIKLMQINYPVNGTNRYVGYWQTSVKSLKPEVSPFDFIEQLPNFGRLTDKQTVNVDFRYIQGCSFDTKEEANSIKTMFQMISKESTTQHVYGIEFIIPSSNSKVEDVKKYYENVAKICQASADTSNLLKSLLAQILTNNLALKKKKGKISHPSPSGNQPKTNGNTVALPGTPGKVDDNLNLNDIQDPNIKNQIKKIKDNIKSEQNNIQNDKGKKDQLVQRANQLLDRLDKDNQQLSVIEPKNEENLKHAQSANQTIAEATNNITKLTDANSALNNTLFETKAQKVEQDKKVKQLTDDYNNIKAEYNKNLDDERNIKKALAEVEAHLNVQTESLASLEDKKKILLHKINELVSEIKKDGDDLESNGKNLQLVQTNFNNLEEESKKIKSNIDELKKKLKDLMKKENDIKKQTDPQHISTMETQKQTTITQLSELEKTLQKNKEELVSFIDPQLGEIFEKAYQEIVNRDNFDPQSYLKILKTIPSYVWTVPS